MGAAAALRGNVTNDLVPRSAGTSVREYPNGPAAHQGDDDSRVVVWPRPYEAVRFVRMLVCSGFIGRHVRHYCQRYKEGGPGVGGCVSPPGTLTVLADRLLHGTRAARAQ
jgi:hypothetical protein